MNNTAFKRLLFYDNSFESKFNYRGLNFWPYVRQYFFKHLNQTTDKKKLKVSIPSFKNILRIIFSHFKLRESEVVYLISNRPQILSLIDQFQSNKPELKKINSLYICQLGLEKPSSKNFIYCDLPKIILRGLSLVSKPKTLSNSINRTFVEGIIMFYYYKLIFSIINPKRVYFINWYDHYPALLALPSSVITTEIQHGIIHNEHPGYNYGVTQSGKIVLPNEFQLWNEDFVKSINLGKVFKHSLFNRKAFNEKITDKLKPRVIIISQHSIRNEIEEQVQQNIEELSKLGELVYRVHPKDRQNLDVIKTKMKGFGEIKVEHPDEMPIEVYLDPANTFVGVFSTLFMDLIIEGYNCIVLNHSSKVAIYNLLDRKNVKQF